MAARVVKVSSPPVTDGLTPLKCGLVWTRQKLYIKVRKQITTESTCYSDTNKSAPGLDTLRFGWESCSMKPAP